MRRFAFRHLMPVRLLAFLLPAFILLPPPAARGQSSGRSYVRTRTMLDSIGSAWAVSVSYADTYGRPSQRVASSEQGHVAVKSEYDGAGREWRKWLPVPSSYSSPDAVFSFYEASLDTYGHEYAKEETRFDPLGRPLSILGAGEEWYDGDKSVRMAYRVNASSSVRKYTAPLGEVSLVKGDFYPAGALSSVLTTDEDGRTTETFTDVLGRVVLERRAGTHDTYYVYDDTGLLRYVLPPQYQDNQTKALFAYDYRYSDSRQLEKRKLPGCDTEQYWHDWPSGRVRFMEDAVLKAAGRNRFWLYDPLGRPAVQGTCTYGNHGRYAVAARYGQGGTPVMGTGYRTDKSNFASGMRLEVAHYYDGYDFLASPIVAGTGKASFLARANPACAKGLETGTVEIASDGDTIVTASYYDWRGRLEQQRRAGPGGILTVTVWERTFTGRVSKETVTVTLPGGETHVAVTSHGISQRTGMPVSTTVTADGRAQRTSLLSFDGLGRVVSDLRGGSAGAAAYGYNTRGWVTSVAYPRFSETVHFADGPGTPRFSGDISSLTWTGADSVTRGYRFSYDGTGRMTEAAYGEGDAVQGVQKYSERAGYSKNGSPTLIERCVPQSGQAVVAERIALSYQGNRLSAANRTAGSVSPSYGRMCFSDNASLSGGEYGYDGCGRMTYDRNKEVTYFGYDLAGSLRRVQFAEGNTLEYSYTPGGRKLKAVVRRAYGDNLRENAYGQYIPLTEEETSGTDSTLYAGPFVLRSGRPAFLLFPGGYCTLPGSGQAAFHYYDRDHLGNVRAVTGEDGTLEQQTHYYPFGTVIYDLSTAPGTQPWKYNGKELEATHGLNWYDYGARWYDPVLVRWDTMDPLCEKYYNVSPYAYCGNNPVKYIDPDGKDGIISIYGSNIKISANIFLYGNGATKEILLQMQNDINNVWGKNYSLEHAGKTYNVDFDINLFLYEGKEKSNPFIIPDSWNPFSRNNYIKVSDDDCRSYVKSGDEGLWRNKGREGMPLSKDDPAPHEVGHILGLKDRYSDKAGIDKGWEDNIMGECVSGKVDNRNISDLLKDVWQEYNKWLENGNTGVFKYEIDP